MKRPSGEEKDKTTAKKSRFSKYGGLKFQSAGNLVTVGDKVHMEEVGKKGRGYRDSVGRDGDRPKEPEEVAKPRLEDRPESSRPEKDRTQTLRTEERSSREGSAEDDGAKFSFGFSKKKPQPQSKETDPASGGETKFKSKEPHTSVPPGGPPPLMSRQRELMTKAFGGDSDSDGEDEGAALVRMAVRGTPRFTFHIKK